MGRFGLDRVLGRPKWSRLELHLHLDCRGSPQVSLLFEACHLDQMLWSC